MGRKGLHIPKNRSQKHADENMGKYMVERIEIYCVITLKENLYKKNVQLIYVTRKKWSKTYKGTSC